jgi:hypothetical protein
VNSSSAWRKNHDSLPPGETHLDFHGVALKDACFDFDQKVHRVLTEKVFPPVQAWVAATDEFIAAQKR